MLLTFTAAMSVGYKFNSSGNAYTNLRLTVSNNSVGCTMVRVMDYIDKNVIDI
jgi:hypothetical protein